MRARCAAWLLWCACAAAAPAARAAPAAPAAPAATAAPAAPTAPAATAAPAAPAAPAADARDWDLCDTVPLKTPPPMPPNVREHEAVVLHAARLLSELVAAGAADEARAAALANATALVPLSPPPRAVALGAPQLRLGVLWLVDARRLFVFQQNNSASLQQYWRTLASAWNASGVVWPGAWWQCGGWAGAAAAHGAGAARAAAALFRTLPAVPCEPALLPLAAQPRCDPLSTHCEARPPTGQEQVEYRCRCRDGLWRPPGAARDARCAACSAAACPGRARAAQLAANLAGMLLCLVVGGVVFNKRKCKAVAMGMWTVLEVVLLGALLMYASAASQYARAGWWRCVGGVWLRELGFVACYGSVVLRLWVLLAEFRTRKAHRWTPRDAEVLRIVAAMLIGCVCYLAAFTATSACVDDTEASGAAGEAGAEADAEADAEAEAVAEAGAGAGACARAAWHHVTAAAELLLLFAGARIAWAARNANVPFQERAWLCVALAAEAAGAAGWRAAAALGAAPERSALAATARAQLSAGAALACVLAPRLWHGYRARSLAQEVSRRGPAEGFAEGEEEATSEEVRAELKRLYVQLELLRNKTLRRDNPHISRRRGGRKPPHRRFSLQKKGSREKALQARRGGKGRAAEASEGGDASRTPEDSVCSVEGPSHFTDGDTQA